MVVTCILEGGTAHKTQQILPGDVITSIDGLVTMGWDLPKVVGSLTGTEHSTVRIGIRRKKESFEIALQRTRASLPSPVRVFFPPYLPNL